MKRRLDEIKRRFRKLFRRFGFNETAFCQQSEKEAETETGITYRNLLKTK